MRAGRRSGRRWRLRDDRRARASPGRTRGGAATTVATHMRVRSAALLDAEEGGSSVSAAGGVELSTTEEKMRSPHRTLLPPHTPGHDPRRRRAARRWRVLHSCPGALIHVRGKISAGTASKSRRPHRSVTRTSIRRFFPSFLKIVEHLR
jgi:hypothetical protein